ncbi:MAG: hypothetical protein EBS29_00510 [Chloroflexia bacterium]|nr:hypothetical protein [Chloroflexia bacterium]
MIGLLALLTLITSCGVIGDNTLHIADVTAAYDKYVGKDITVAGAYLAKPGDKPLSILAAGVSTLDNGLDAQALGDAIWVDKIPEDIALNLHRPGDATYGFVKLTGKLEAGTFGPESNYKYQIVVRNAEVIEQIKRIEQRITNTALSDGKVSLFDLIAKSSDYNGKKITTQGYYFWNSAIYVLAEGISTEEDGSNPQPVGKIIWMEGFPPDKSAELTIGPNNSFVWGKVEVTGAFQSGGNFGRDGAYKEFIQAESATVLK